MTDGQRRRRALMLAATLVGWSGLAEPKLPSRLLVPLHGTLAGSLVAWTGAPLGLRRSRSSRGLRLGVPVAVAVSAAAASSTMVPAVRRGMAQRDLPAPVAEWLLLRIPVGTVWSEEAAYRGALGALAARAFGRRWGRIVQAGAFGLSHVADARGAGEPVTGTVVATAIAGWAFGWLYDRSGSLAAPMLAHLATNGAGALAALAVAGRRRGP